MTYRFRLLSEEGHDMGPLASRRAKWREGETLARWHGEKLTVVGLVEPEPREPFLPI